jgi:hypothetical protein
MRDLYGAYKDAIRTNIRDTQLFGLGTLGQEVGLTNVHMVSMAPALYPCPPRQCTGALLLINWDIWNELQATVFSDLRFGTENAEIDVLNGTLTPGLAGYLADLLAAGGISRVRVHVDEYANNLVYDTTVIIDVTGDSPTTLDKLKALLDVGDESVLTPADPDAQQFLGTNSDIIVVLGGDTTLDPGEFATPVEEYVPPEEEYIPPEETLPPEETEVPTEVPTVEPEPTEAPTPEPEPEPTLVEPTPEPGG